MTSSTIITPNNRDFLDQFARLAPGTYILEYTDQTHLNDDTWIQLCNVQIEQPQQNTLDSSEIFTGSYFTLTISPQLPAPIETKNEQHKKAEEGRHKERLRNLLDQLSLCLVRAGLLQPVLTNDSLLDVIALLKRDAIILIPDTNALTNGSVHWLLQVFRKTNLTILPVAISLVQAQEHDRQLKEMVGDRKISNLKAALRSRTMVNCSLALLNHRHEQYQVLAVQPELLRYVRKSSGKPEEHDEMDVLEDRLFVEAIHEVLGSSRSHTQKRVLTADVTFARILYAEAIPVLNLYPPTLTLNQTIDCLRYDPIASMFMGCTISDLLMALAQTFGTVRLRQEKNSLVEIAIYWPGKNLQHWLADSIIAKFDLPQEKPNQEEKTIASSSASTSKTTKTKENKTKKESEPHQVDLDFSNHFHFNTVAQPCVSFIPIVSFLGAALKNQPATLKAITNKLPKFYKVSDSAAENAAEALLQTGLISVAENTISTTNLANEFSNAIEIQNLDRASEILCNFAPYATCFQFLRKTGELPEELNEELRNSYPAKTSLYAYRNLRPFLIYLGQAWTDNGKTVDGSQRPPDDSFVEHFKRIFEHEQKAQIVSLEDMILRLAREIRISPWATKQAIEHLVEQQRLSDFRFDPATGTKPRTKDRVISTSVYEPELLPVAIDRIFISGRPVFTVVRK